MEYGRKRLQGLRQNVPVVNDNNNSLVSISRENAKEKLRGMTNEEANPSPVTDLLGCPIDRRYAFTEYQALLALQKLVNINILVDVMSGTSKCVL
jgi:hypothetical protein